jgi:hypothetical protein
VTGCRCRCRACIKDREGVWALAQTFVVCSHCGNKRCPKAEHHAFACSGSNEPGQLGVLEAELPPAPEPDPADLAVIAKLKPLLIRIAEIDDGDEDVDVEEDIAVAVGITEWCKASQRFTAAIPQVTSDLREVRHVAAIAIRNFSAWGYRILHQGNTDFVTAALFPPSGGEIGFRAKSDATALLGAVVLGIMKDRGYVDG